MFCISFQADDFEITDAEGKWNKIVYKKNEKNYPLKKSMYGLRNY